MRRRDHQELDRLHNVHQGQPCWILGTGPSVNQIAPQLIARLGSQLTIGVNYWLALKWPFLPQYYIAREIDALLTGPAGLPGLAKLVADGESRFGKPTSKWLGSQRCPSGFPSWHWLYTDSEQEMQKGAFPDVWGEEGLSCLAEGVLSGLTVGVPLAAWLGCNPIFLVGFDNTTQGYAYDATARRNYRPDSAERAALAARRALGEHGVTLVDCSGGSLPLVKCDLAAIISSNGVDGAG